MRLDVTLEELVAIHDALYHQKERYKRYLNMLCVIDARCAELLPDYKGYEGEAFYNKDLRRDSNDDSEEV